MAAPSCRRNRVADCEKGRENDIACVSLHNRLRLFARGHDPCEPKNQEKTLSTRSRFRQLRVFNQLRHLSCSSRISAATIALGPGTRPRILVFPPVSEATSIAACSSLCHQAIAYSGSWLPAKAARAQPSHLSVM